MSFKRYTKLLKHGRSLSREEMSEKVINAVREFNTSESYKGAMILAGRLKAIAMMANSDDYWREQVEKGFARELAAVEAKPHDR